MRLALKWHFQFSVLFFGCLTSLAAVSDPKRMDLNEWAQVQRPVSLRNLLRNISAPGTARGSVIASPSTSNPNYFYHWVRDAAQVMDVVVTQYENTTEPAAKNRYQNMLLDYIGFSRFNQETPNLSGGLGEPKFNVDGSAYMESWGRPQDDGPAMRASALMHLAQVWIKEGKENWVREKLYNGTTESVVKRDLEYVSHHWRNTSFELWEEVKGHHFHTRMVQRRAMVEGAKFAAQMNDGAAAAWYQAQVKDLSRELERHWNPSKKILVITLDRDGGLDYKYSELDSAVVLGVLQGDAGDGFLAVNDDRVLSTVNKLEEAFFNLYNINRNGEPGIAIGRYPEDRYDGFSSGGQGNPWFINTSAFGEYYYRLAKLIEQSGRVQLNRRNAAFYNSLGLESIQGKALASGDKDFVRVIGSLRAKGDAFLARVKFHIDASGSLSEQINRESGFMQGARDLTWSYAALLTAFQFRK